MQNGNNAKILLYFIIWVHVHTILHTKQDMYGYVLST